MELIEFFADGIESSLNVAGGSKFYYSAFCMGVVALTAAYKSVFCYIELLSSFIIFPVLNETSAGGTI
jgi:hypothetical protein